MAFLGRYVDNADVEITNLAINGNCHSLFYKPMGRKMALHQDQNRNL